jgi:hypothetical protein
VSLSGVDLTVAGTAPCHPNAMTSTRTKPKCWAVFGWLWAELGDVRVWFGVWRCFGGDGRCLGVFT